MLDYDFISQKAKDSRIDDVTIEREYWQLLFLQKFYNQKYSEKVYFKGGTAIRFLLNSFRFSEDLDFTSTLKLAQVEDLVEECFSFLAKNSTTELELKKEKVPDRFADVSVSFRFLFLPAKASQKVPIRLDMSLRETPLTREQTVLTPFDYPISPYPLVMHLSDEEIMAEKLRALFIRGKPRDLFDLWFLLTKKVAINKEFIEKKFSLYEEVHFSRKELKERIQAFNRQELKQDLNQFLPQNYREFYQKLPEETLKLI